LYAWISPKHMKRNGIEVEMEKRKAQWKEGSN
jgi:hypothetical protein